ncbi:hypothetical protein Taro_040227 [Colocasia esculenta]|uniref:Uncharacterized protein n=1 Tax=Colocasia esculenta TaxID=4460 RepID=A0A843WII2_COLES|nr:hypothetical protein [Colocasia esculenta]
MAEHEEVPEDEIVEAYQENLVDVPVNGEIFDVDVTEGINVRVDMSSRNGSRVRRLRTVDDVSSHSPEDFVVGHPSQAILPITQGASSTASASSSVAETPSWGRGTGRRGPSRGATERRLEPGHKWNVRVIGGYGDIAERNKQNCAHQNMTYRRGRTSIYQLKDDFVKTHQREPDRMEVFRMGRCKDLPDGTQRWVDDESRDRFVREDDTDDDSFPPE